MKLFLFVPRAKPRKDWLFYCTATGTRGKHLVVGALSRVGLVS